MVTVGTDGQNNDECHLERNGLRLLGRGVEALWSKLSVSSRRRKWFRGNQEVMKIGRGAGQGEE
jgi:hypothetical protein